jgi:hypothetical protein
MMVLDGVGLHLSRSFLEEVDEDPHQLLGGKVDEGWLEGGKEIYMSKTESSSAF